MIIDVPNFNVMGTSVFTAMEFSEVNERCPELIWNGLHEQLSQLYRDPNDKLFFKLNLMGRNARLDVIFHF
jgi:hypothetical protein